MTMPISDEEQIKSLLNCCDENATNEVINDGEIWPEE